MNPFLLSSRESNDPIEPAGSPGDEANTRRPAPRILVVDDEKVIADTIVEILNREV